MWHSCPHLLVKAGEKTNGGRTYSSGRRRGAGCAGCRRSRSRGGIIGARLGDLSRAAVIWQGNVKGVDVEGKVLERVGVADGLGGVVDGELEALLVVVGVVLDDALAHAGHVEEAVDQVRGKVEVE